MARTTAWIVVAVCAGLAVGLAVGWVLHTPEPTSTAPLSLSKQGFLPEGGGTPVATYDGGVVTDDELRAFAHEFPDQQGSQATDRAISDELAAGRAQAEDVVKDPAVAAKLKHVLADGWRQKKLDELAKQSAGDEKALRAYYEQHKSDYVRPERLVLKVVDLPFPKGNVAAKKGVREKADALMKATTGKDSASFEQKAKAVGVVTDQKVSAQELQLLLGSEANSKQAWLMVGIGEEKLFETDGMFRLLRLEGREAPLQTSFEDARPTLQSQRWYELRAKELERLDDSLRKESGLKVDEAAVKRALGK
ncbi:MAG: peptidyl-prolyl cis-trans isomerase [Myxococcaceae bacterium]